MSDDDLRAELVRLAYGDDSPPAVSADARRRLELLDAPVTESSPPPDVPIPDPVTVPRPRRRRALIGALAGTLAVGLLAGAAIASAGRSPSATKSASGTSTSSPYPGLIQTQATYDVTKDPTGTSRLAAGDPSVVSTSPPGSALGEADALLARPATSVDSYPLTPASDDAYVDSSIRLVATSATGLKFYIARQRGTSGGYCLLESNAAGSLADGSIGTSTCAGRAEFQASGMTLTADRFSMTWQAGDVSVRLTGNGSASG